MRYCVKVDSVAVGETDLITSASFAVMCLRNFTEAPAYFEEVSASEEGSAPVEG